MSHRPGESRRAASLRWLPWLPWLVAGLVGWAGLVSLGWSLWGQDPPRAGFDLALLLDAARDVLAGRSPYHPAMLGGAGPDATSLFYSYPPPVAQAMTLLAWLPDGPALVLWGAGATLGLGAAAALLARAAGWPARAVAVRAVLVAPLALPFSVAVLFGNLDAWYPLAYGLLLAAMLPGAGRGTVVAGGVAVALVTLAKLHPVTLGAWLAGRAWAARGGAAGRALGAGLVAAIVIVALSLLAGGSGPWQEYARVVQAGAGAAVVDPRNAAPVSILGQLGAADPGGLRGLQAVIALAATGGSLAAGLRLREPLAGLALAAAASLVVLPVTWYHYPVALLPAGAWLALRHPRSRPALVAALVVVDAAIAWPILLWPAVAILLAAVAVAVRAPGHGSGAGTTRHGPPVPVTGRTTRD